jgi:hypothetical protein
MTSTKIRATVAALAATFTVAVAVAPAAHARPKIIKDNAPIGVQMEEHGDKANIR